MISESFREVTNPEVINENVSSKVGDEKVFEQQPTYVIFNSEVNNSGCDKKKAVNFKINISISSDH